MRLSVLKGEPSDDVTRVLALADQALADFCAAGVTTEAMDLGLALIAPDLPRVYDANRVFQARVPDGADVAQLWREAHAWYASRAARCWRVMPARLAPEHETAPLIAHMEREKWSPVEFDVLRLARAPALPERTHRIISARAAMRQYEAFARAAAEEVEPQLAELALRHLDDPRYEALVALHEGRVVARVVVMTSGEVGLIEQVHVLAAMRGRGLGRAVVEAAIELCARSQFRHVMLTCDAGNAVAQALYASLGFEKLGVARAWQAPDA